jgi:hypothetical protein
VKKFNNNPPKKEVPGPNTLKVENQKNGKKVLCDNETDSSSETSVGGNVNLKG